MERGIVREVDVRVRSRVGASRGRVELDFGFLEFRFGNFISNSFVFCLRGMLAVVFKKW